MSEREDMMDGVAIIGMAGRFPGAGSIRELWSNLVAGRESVRFFTNEELLASGVLPEVLKDPLFVGARGVLDGVEEFDPGFFGMTVRDAEVTDPQQRVFLECCWQAFEDAALDPGEVRGGVGVYAGCSLNTYVLRQVFGEAGAAEAFVQAFQADAYQVLVGNDKDYLATRVAHKLNLRGPAMTVQTACSSSLVAVCQAVAALQAYQCDLALAGGVSITFPQVRGHVYQEGAIPSADGHCRPFDASASGTVFGSGCGVVLLKRLSEAVEDGDPVYAVIRGAALNNDGGDKMSFLAPSVEGQAEVVALAHALAGVTADSISYVEAHGTATPLGDPIEVAGLTQAFRSTTEARGFCGLGTLKSNFGHLEVAAGVAGLIKTALALRHRRLPATLHFKEANPKIDFASTPFYVVDSLREWPSGGAPRRAGVSSFGVGGTNAHVVLEEAPEAVEGGAGLEEPRVLLVSARSERALEGTARALAEHLQLEQAEGRGPCLG
ncbi:MAG: type I polyketide synthase, partial [Limisphaerales bacterium]